MIKQTLYTVIEERSPKTSEESLIAVTTSTNKKMAMKAFNQRISSLKKMGYKLVRLEKYDKIEAILEGKNNTKTIKMTSKGFIGRVIPSCLILRF